MNRLVVLTCIMSVLLFGTSLSAAQPDKSVTDLPDISVIGNIVTTLKDGENRLDVKEIEFAFQQYLYPSVRADIFAALHKEDSGERAFELEEAYITFLNATDLFVPELNWPAIGLVMGKKKLSFGKINPLHPEQWDFVDRPIATQQFLGGDEGLSAEGLKASYLLPVSFFSQVELGGWTANPIEEPGEFVAVTNRLLTARLWNGFALSESQELEVGASYLLGNASNSDSLNQQSIVGLDITYLQELGADQSLKLQSELYQAIYSDSGAAREDQSGGFASAYYKFHPKYSVGARVGTLGKHGDTGDDQTQWSLLFSRQLTETSKFRVQYNTGDNIDDVLYFQFIFGMGPHSHVLQ